MGEADNRLAELESRARLLEPDESVRRQWLALVDHYAEDFLGRLSEAPAYAPAAGRDADFLAGIDEAPADLRDLLETLAVCVDARGINPASGGYLGYIPGGGVYPSALGDFLADIANRYAGIAFASPGAVRMEQDLVRWMANLVNLPATAGGDLTSGGSVANLSAIVTARDALEIRARQVPDCCIYLTRQTHHCVDKSLRIAGLGEARRRYVSLDARNRMDPGNLHELLESDRACGLKPFMVVASAGTTDSGSVDPLMRVAGLANAYGAWLHIDAAYGGFFMLCEEGRAVLQGIGSADSVVMDPHKGLFLPFGSGAVLVRDVDALARAHAYAADYMQDTHMPGDQHSPADLSPELSRPFRGLRLWLPLRLFGLAPFRAALAEKIWLARYFRERLAAQPGWEVGPAPDLSVVTYRYLPARGDVDAFNRRLLTAVHVDGRVFISSTRLDGRFVLRLAVLNFRTHRWHIDYLLDLLARSVVELSAS